MIRANDLHETSDLFGASGANAAVSSGAGYRRSEFCIFAQGGAENPAEKAVKFLESLKIPQGPKAGNPVFLAPFQKQFVAGAMADGIAAAVLSIGRGNAKTALSAGIALGALLGVWDHQRQREVLIAARTRERGKVAWDFCGRVHRVSALGNQAAADLPARAAAGN